ncbi:hypothetical protein AcV7_008300 [Taiwanofungus camphoratus]|nr:hypothetical protein AcV7_008300 [Antrodia cinnamomea]
MTYPADRHEGAGGGCSRKYEHQPRKSRCGPSHGLYIIDLEAPLNVPRFLPQGGTWDVADVQWNPHMARSEYIVSTSSEKLLIWNLLLSGKTSIEHVLRSHYRAITDINWHTSDPDIVVSTGIDSWLWAWDLRTTQKPVMGLCAFNSGGTQVKWNRQDGNILASSHLNEVLIWDRRKGSLPISNIKAHNAKIYGIDWAHDRRNEIVTCSLDKTIKIWDIQDCAPTITFHTAYPVWRARDLPFGRGVLSLPQRGETALELWAHRNPSAPVSTFEGHADVVKEFVWRKGVHEGSEFQLITWSKDKTLRFWPIDMEVMQKAGITPRRRTSGAVISDHGELKVSFSNPPVGTDLPPALSAPVGHRAILAEVRAPVPPRPAKVNPVSHIRAQSSSEEQRRPSGPSVTHSKPIPIAQEKGGTMTRGYPSGRSAQITTFAWLSSVKVGGRKEGSSGPGSGAESGNISRLSSISRPPSQPDRSASRAFACKQHSRDKVEDHHHEGETSQILQDEITSVVNKLSSSKIKLEKADLTKKLTCTFGMHGPWGDSTLVFIRITFSFPRDYPNGIPNVDLERNPLISMKNRAFILRRLRTIRERQRPCLEKCLRFLLFGDEDEHLGQHVGMGSESSSEDEALPVSRKYRGPAFSSLRGDKNLAEPRTSQGVFGVNGELVCFFRAPPRIVRNPLRDISVSPSIASRGTDSAPRLFQSPALLSDAVRQLGYAAHDREVESVERTTEDANNILRIMTNLLTFSQQKPKRTSEHSRPYESIPASYSLRPTRSTVLIRDLSTLVGADIIAAREYVLDAHDPAEMCRRNADTARLRGRMDHERIFKLLETVFAANRKSIKPGGASSLNRSHDGLTLYLLEKLYKDFSSAKDIQMLAVLSILLFQLPVSSFASRKGISVGSPECRRPRTGRDYSLSPIWPQPFSSPTSQPVAPSLSSPSSSRGSWSSLFNTNSMKQLVTGPKSKATIPVPEMNQICHDPSSYVSSQSRDPPLPPTTLATKSCSEADISSRVTSTITFSSAGHPRRPTFSQVLSAGATNLEKRRIVANLASGTQSRLSLFQTELHDQLLCHIVVYADILLAWQLPEKRAELLKSIESQIRSNAIHPLIVDNTVVPDGPRFARICEHSLPPQNYSDVEKYPLCALRANSTQCSICRLPVKGLSHSCLVCFHMSHVACWEGWRNTTCASGCGCQCGNTRIDAANASGMRQSLSLLQM